MLSRSEEINLQLEAAMALQKTFLDSVETMNEVELHTHTHTHTHTALCVFVSECRVLSLSIPLLHILFFSLTHYRSITFHLQEIKGLRVRLQEAEEYCYYLESERDALHQELHGMHARLHTIQQAGTRLVLNGLDNVALRTQVWALQVRGRSGY